ncbi:MAG: sulfite exporter TauE/SafE family protein [Candidatus Aminicenantes bacterium]|nr:sulfite exporter TauE/SafE family protein [Candidatus Aminicenantes bacterium]
MDMPISGETILIWPLLLTGFTVGVCGGFFGIGGAFMVTPTLNIFGFPMAYAIGTDMCHMIGKSIVSSFRHWKLGHVEVKLALFMVIGTVPGVEAGAQTIMWLDRRGIAGPVVRYVYMAILLSLGFYLLWEVAQAYKKARTEGVVIKDVFGNRLTRFVQRTRLSPVAKLEKSGITLSVWWMILIGAATGYLASFMGVGGGFIRVPALLYVIGLPMKLAVGTDLFSIIFTSAYGGFSYAVKGVVEINAAVIMVVGAAIGAQIGSIATRYVHGLKMRLYFALCVFGSAFGLIAKQISTVYRDQWMAGVRAFLAEGGRTALEIAEAIKDKIFIQSLLAGRPEWSALAGKEQFWTSLAGVLSIGLASGLSFIIMYFCFKGILVEKRTGKILGA